MSGDDQILKKFTGPPAFATLREDMARQSTDARSDAPVVSAVVPMMNESGGAGLLVDEIAAALKDTTHEIIVVDDGSSDDTVKELKEARKRHSSLRILRHAKNAGQSRALRTGILAARADIIATMDGDGQNNPADLPQLIEALKQAAGDPARQVAMVAGERRTRQDSAAKKWASTYANKIRRKLLDDGAADTGCGLKVFYREAFLRLPYFDHMHRYLPALIRREGFGILFVPVGHRPRAHGASKYNNFERFMVAIRDLLGVLWLNARSKGPGDIHEECD